MRSIFEIGAEGRSVSVLPDFDVPEVILNAPLREKAPKLPNLSENDISRHFTEMAKATHGVNDGSYPLGSCTMKYNPKINDEAAYLPGFKDVHPLQENIDGCIELIGSAGKAFCEITGMDMMSFQPAAGAHGEFTGLLLIKAFHESRGDHGRNKIIVPDSAHGTNPASSVMAGYEVINIPSLNNGCVDLDALRASVGEDTAGLMLTNPNTVGLFDDNILQITEIVHEAGGLCYYDGANLNAIMGIVRPGDMGFDCVHINLHKSFSTPHGGGGPGSGPVGCRSFLAEYLPGPVVSDGKFVKPSASIGRVRSFFGNFLVLVRAYTYILMLGKDGIPEVARNAVLNANYMRKALEGKYKMPYDRTCMHEFVMSLEHERSANDITAMDIAKSLLDYGIHPPTMYFPLIVHEALMVEPTETESKETLDEIIYAFNDIYEKALNDPEYIKSAPHNTIIGRPDEVKAARRPVLRYDFGEEL